ncbi:MAG: HAMP domain-containing histidine kinase [Actinomycetia bacterium]|nr:HAMP domain-containing histidine kinase [Actinomycetes bacterium]
MKWRLMIAFAGLIAMVLLAQDVPLATYLRRVESERLLADLRSDAFLLAGAAEDVLSGEATGSAIDLHATVVAYAETEGGYVVVVDANGVLVESSDATDVIGTQFANSNRPEFNTALVSGQPNSGSRSSVDAGGDIVYVVVPVRSGLDVVGAIRITFPAAVIDQRANEKVRGLVLVGLISMLAAALAAIVIANTISSPLRRLRRSTEHLAAGDFTQRAIDNEGPPEVRSLARSFNTMTERIATLVGTQRAFVGDASHQLRTPLTALRLQLERAAAMVDDDPAGARARLEAASEETERLQRLVEGLLMIARSDGSRPELERVDVSALVRERAEVWGPFADERGVQLTIACPGGLAAMAVPNALEQIIDNYVDNAMNAVSAGGTITLSASRRNDSVSVHVADEGPGMPPEHLAHAFDRFWRAPNAPHGGSGIGLAVAHHLADLSGGSVELRNRTDRTGLIASVELPAVN